MPTFGSDASTNLCENLLLGRILAGGVVKGEAFPLGPAIEHNGASVLLDLDTTVGQTLRPVSFPHDGRPNATDDFDAVIVRNR